MTVKLEKIANKMRNLEKKIEQSKCNINSDLLIKQQAVINLLIIALDKAVDNMENVVDRFFSLKGGEKE